MKNKMEKLYEIEEHGKIINDIILKHCEYHQCCEMDNKNEVVIDILAETTGINKNDVVMLKYYKEAYQILLQLDSLRIARDDEGIKDLLDKIKLFFKNKK